MLHNNFKKVGYFSIVAVFIAALLNQKYWDSSAVGSYLEIVGFISLSFIAFAKEKLDDEFLNHLRVKAVVITLLISFLYAILDAIFFNFRHLLILEVLQIQLLLYIVLFRIIKKIRDDK